MDFIIGSSLQILIWLGSYLLHSTLLFIIVFGALKMVSSNESKEHLLRFSMFGGVITSLIQITTGWGYKFSSPDGSMIQMGDAASTASPSTLLSLHWPIICLVLWIMISITLIFRYLATYRLFIRSVKTLTNNQQFEKWIVRNHDLLTHGKKFEFLFSQEMISPFVHAGNKIIIPELALTKLNDRELRSMLAHEMAHVVRHDWYWLQVYQLIQSIFFFQPLNFITKRMLIRNTETICDSRAVHVTHDKKSLARSILEIATWSGLKNVPLVSGMAFQTSFLTERINAIIDSKAPVKNRKWISALILLNSSVFCIATTPVFPTEQQDPGFERRKGASMLRTDSILKQGKPYEIEVYVPMEKEVEVPAGSESTESSTKIDVDLHVENKIELNPIK